MTAVVTRRAPRSRSFATEIANVARRCVDEHAGKAWPATKWFADPVGFHDKILGVRLWSRQEDILCSIRDNARTSVSGGRKIGKDFILAGAALWWFACVEDGRVFSTATTAKQIDGILYRQIRQLFVRSGRCLACKLRDPDAPPPCEHSAQLVGKVGEQARTGIKAQDFREIVGFTSDKAEGMAGWSGRILLLVDEASGVSDPIYATMRGNLAGDGCSECSISNPTRASGWFFDAHHSKADLYKLFVIPSTETPNVVEGRNVIPGLATREWVEEQKREWGEDSALYLIHVLGKFVLNEQGAIFSVHALKESFDRWADVDEAGNPAVPATGPLVLGIDPAGESADGDECAFAARRGMRLVGLTTRRGLSPAGHLIEALGLMAMHGGGPDTVIVIDREGETGNKVWGEFVAYLQVHPGAFELIGVRSSERAHRKPMVYDRVRDELCAVLADWLRDGGAIPDEPKLAKDLNAFRWESHISGRTKATSKKDLKKILGRSPDRGDAVALSCWVSVAVGATAEVAATQKQPDAYERAPDQVFDPYAAQGGGAYGGGIDPYGGGR